MVVTQSSELSKATNGMNSLLQSFGSLSLSSVSQLIKQMNILSFSALNEAKDGVHIRARLSSVRNMKKMAFLILRNEKHETLQCFASKSSGLLDFISQKLTPEAIVIACGNLVKAENPIKSCSISNFELNLEKIYCISSYNHPQVNKNATGDADTSKLTYSDLLYPEYLPNSLAPALQKRLDRRVIDLRTPHNNAIVKSVSLISNYMRQFLLENDFTEIYTPKIIGAASEGGADVFKLKYYDRDAFLSQSPQLYKQMALCADLDRVFTVGPVFRAENSNTHRHLSEFTGFDLEMTFNNHYHEVLHMLDRLIRFTFDKYFSNHSDLIEKISDYFGPVPHFKYPSPTKIFHYREAIALLRNANVNIGDFDDINTTNEKLLGKIIKEKYDTDYYVIDKFPLANRAFYTMEDTDEPGSGYSNSYDIFFRGEEILSGAQRISNADDLRSKIEAVKIDASGLKDYVDAIDQGVAPHGGGGFGLERIILFMLGIKNIRNVSLFPRDPQRLEP